MDVKERFSGRAGNYARYRPAYPDAMFSFLTEKAGVPEEGTVADIGSGTGIFTRQIARIAGKVFAVEPNGEMRAAAERTYGLFPNVVSVKGSAEATALPNASADLVTAAECYHWFDPMSFRAECLRILRPGGKAAVFWNLRIPGDWVTEGCHRLWVRYSPDYDAAAHPWDKKQDSLRTFFGGPFHETHFRHPQRQDREAFFGRLLSASYSPLPGQDGYADFLAGLEELFDAHAKDGFAEYAYDTTLFWGGLTSEEIFPA